MNKIQNYLYVLICLTFKNIIDPDII